MWSIEKGAVAVMDNVGERIMRLWKGCKEHTEKIVFMISVGRHKSYCGLVEMRGPWQEVTDEYLDGWYLSEESRRNHRWQ